MLTLTDESTRLTVDEAKFGRRVEFVAIKEDTKVTHISVILNSEQIQELHSSLGTWLTLNHWLKDVDPFVSDAV